MIDCPRCGTPNAEGSRFCNSCGNSLVAHVGIHERRVVTALFADLARSTGMGERLDPEVTRRLVGDFFELARREVEARGGTVEKFSGDAVMAVFGIPQAHEDDPERAVRAAMAIRDGLVGLSAAAEAQHGMELRARIGIESGEVVVGDPFGGATMATGDAMNLAARLEQQAQPDEVVIGEVAWEQVRDLVEAQAMGKLELRGHETPIEGWRVTTISTEVGRPRGVPGLEAPLTGRNEELALLLNAADRARLENKAVLVTILGVPGVGKSRLVRETTSRLKDAGWSVVKGRCLPYGDGITYWPLAEMVRALASIPLETEPGQARQRLRDISPDDDVADRLALALGLTEVVEASAGSAGSDQSGSGAKEIAYAFRRLVEHVSAQKPVVLVFDDIHWAEPPLLDLIEYVATWTRDAPLLILAPSRPELVDNRPGWGSGRMESNRINLQPLTEEESRALLGALLTVEDLPAELRQRVLDRAEGNPLFVEEVVRMLIEEGVVVSRDGHWYATQEAANVRVPDSVEALIRARLDTLPPPERVVLQAASVVGRVFQQSAVVALAKPPEVPTPVEQHLEDAILRDLITDERSPDEPTYRFRHILIRDVAYATLPKARRADLHTAVATWLRSWVGARMDEFVEIEAYHLEQSVRLKREVGATVEDEQLKAAVDSLAASAAKADARGDHRAVRSFVDRSLALDPSALDSRLESKWHYIEALSALGENTRAGQLAEELEHAAHAQGRPDLEGRSILAKALGIWVGPDSADATTALAELQRARELLTAAQDWRYVARVLEYLGFEGWWKGQLDGALATWGEMAEVARQHHMPTAEAQALLHMSKVFGIRARLDERIQLLHRARDLAVDSGSRLMQARAERALGLAIAQTESAEEGRRLLTSAGPVLDELGDTDEFALAEMFLGDIDFREDQLDSALAHYQRTLELVHDNIGHRPEVKRRMAWAHLLRGDLDRAEALAEEAVAETAKDDWATVSTTNVVLGQVRDAQGRYEEAEQLLRRAVEVVETTEFPRWDQYLGLAALLIHTGRVAEARENIAKARGAAPPTKTKTMTPSGEHVEKRAVALEAEAAEIESRTS